MRFLPQPVQWVLQNPFTAPLLAIALNLVPRPSLIQPDFWTIIRTTAMGLILLWILAEIYLQAQEVKRLSQQVNHDSLTGLPDLGTMLHDGVSLDTKRNSDHGTYSILTFDVVGFTNFNIAYGITAGDSLLSRVAQYLESATDAYFNEPTGNLGVSHKCLCPKPNVYRIGGDVFAVTLCNIATTELENYKLYLLQGISSGTHVLSATTYSIGATTPTQSDIRRSFTLRLAVGTASVPTEATTSFIAAYRKCLIEMQADKQRLT